MNEPSPNRTLRPLLVEFLDRTQEAQFRESVIDIDIRHGYRLLLIISLVLTVFLIFEATSLSNKLVIVNASIARLLVIVSGLVLARVLLHWRSILVLDSVLIAYVVIFCFGNDMLNLALAMEINDDHWLAIPAGGYLIATLGVYVATPIRFSLQVAGAVCFAVAFFLLVAIWPLKSNINIMFVVLLFAAANVIGITAAYRMQELRRAQWHNLEQERQVSEKLHKEIEERERLEEELRKQAITDPLTGIFNRRLLFREGEDIFHQATRYDRALSLMLFDIDHFKRINDTYGHAAGDEVIKSVVGAVAGTLREPDLFYRYGGEEFAVLLPETDMAGASRIAERVRRAVESMTVKIEGQSERITISIGVTAMKKDDHEFDALILRADDALYTAKDKGRNVFVCSV